MNDLVKKLELTKGQFRFGIAVGIMLGTMALVILSFVKFENASMARMQMEKDIKHELIKHVKDTCGEVYPTVHAVIDRNNKMIIECRTQ